MFHYTPGTEITSIQAIMQDICHAIIPKPPKSLSPEITAHNTECIPPPTYVLDIDPSASPNFIAIGCQGNGKESQEKVAAEIEQWLIHHPDKTPQFILLLGDNVYNDGITSPTDSRLSECFDKIYLKHPHLKKIPFFVIQGNHDQNRHNKKTPWSKNGIEIGLNQVTVTYLDETKKRIYQGYKPGQRISLEDLHGWNMPGRAYSLLVGNTQLFCIDSNTYISDLIQYEDAQKTGAYHLLAPNNQAKWLENEVLAAKKAGRTTLLALHHPPITPGKQRSDLKLYLTDTEQAAAIKLLQPELDELEKEREHLFPATTKAPHKKKKISYNVLIRSALMRQNKNLKMRSPADNFEFDTILSAHDHNGSIFNNKQSGESYGICEVGAGIGGGGLQSMLDFEGQKNMGFFCKQHGFVHIVCDPASHQVDHTFYIGTGNQAKHRLAFNNQSTEAVRHYKSSISQDEQKSIQKLCDATKAAVHGYLAFLAQKQADRGNISSFFYTNKSHGEDGAMRAINLLTYISQAEADDFLNTTQNIYAISKWKGKTTNPTQHSLISFLNTEFQKVYLADFETVCNYNYSAGPSKLHSMIA